MGRGVNTLEVQEYAKKFLGRDFMASELRLIPYIQYKMVNERKINFEQINRDENKILVMWRKAGYLEGGRINDPEIRVSKEFWDFMNGVLWLAYANYK